VRQGRLKKGDSRKVRMDVNNHGLRDGRKDGGPP